ncbi:MAG TPA: DUF1259 domain-containing protein [Gemmatimonadales bacterium]|nr:DUF1259 domain-containing protein [Gemmatimonadales bacterium]
MTSQTHCPHRRVRVARHIVVVVMGCTLSAVAPITLVPPAAHAQGSAQDLAGARDPRWAPIRKVFGQGEAEGPYFRVNLPRSDLHVSIGGDALDPDFEFTSYIGFMPAGRGVLAMGESILLEDEVPAVLAEARRQHVDVTAVHNHLQRERPRIIYVHVMAEGAPDDVAKRLRALFAKSATPLKPLKPEPSRADWSAIDAVLGTHSEAEGSVAEYVFPRREQLTVRGRPVESSGALETASEVVFQQLGGGRVANTGELYLLPSEVESVVRALSEHGLDVTALHNHMLDDGPAHYWVHWYATGNGPTLARGVEAALAQMNSARIAAAGE